MHGGTQICGYKNRQGEIEMRLYRLMALAMMVLGLTVFAKEDIQVLRHANKKEHRHYNEKKKKYVVNKDYFNKAYLIKSESVKKSGLGRKASCSGGCGRHSFEHIAIDDGSFDDINCQSVITSMFRFRELAMMQKAGQAINPNEVKKTYTDVCNFYKQSGKSKEEFVNYVWKGFARIKIKAFISSTNNLMKYSCDEIAPRTCTIPYSLKETQECFEFIFNFNYNNSVPRQNNQQYRQNN